MDAFTWVLTAMAGVGFVLIVSALQKIRYVEKRNRYYSGWKSGTPKQERVRRLFVDSLEILNHHPRMHSRERMVRRGMTHRRWNSAWALLKDCGVEGHNRKQVERRLMRKVQRLYRIADDINVFPY